MCRRMCSQIHDTIWYALIFNCDRIVFNELFTKLKGSLCPSGNTCAHLGRIHNGGPNGCSNKNTDYYRQLNYLYLYVNYP